MNVDKYLVDTITYWAPSGRDVYGATTFSAPTTISGRFVKKMEQVINGTGELVSSLCIAWVDQAVELGGYLYEGTSTNLDPTESVVDSYEIISYKETKDLKGNIVLRKAWM